MPLASEHVPSISRRLSQLRFRYGLWLVCALAVSLAAVAAIFVYAALLLAPHASNPLRIVLLALLGLGVIASAVRLVRPARPLRSMRSFAEYLQTSLQGSRNDFETALALESQSHPDPVTRSFVTAHLGRVYRLLGELPKYVVSRPHNGRHDAAAAILWIGLVLVALLKPDRLAEAKRAWLHWDSSEQTGGGSLVKGTTIVAEFTFTIHPPAYTGLEAETITGNGEVLRAYRGSEVEVALRLQGSDTGARLAIPGGAVVELPPQGKGFQGKFVVTDKGPFTLSIHRGGGWMQDQTERQIELIADQAPGVRVLAPADGITKNPSEEFALRFEASDDFGFTKGALVIDSGTGEKRFPLPVSESGTRFVAGKTFNLGEWGVKEGAVVKYYVEVFDNDTISGPKRGTSRPQTVEIYSPRKNHAALLDRQDRLFVQVINVLGDQIELPATFGPTVGGKLAGLKMRLGEATNEFTALVAAFRADPVAEAASTVQLEAIGHRLKAFSAEVGTYAQSVSAGAGAAEYPGFRPRGILTMEKITMDFAELMRHDRMNDLLVTGQDLQQAREDLRRMLDDYKKNPSPAKLEALKSKVAEIKQLMDKLAQQQMASSESLPDEFVNADAFKKAQAENPAKQLDDLQKLLEGSDPQRALAEMEKFEQNLGAMLAKLDQAGQQANQQANAGPYQELSKALNEVSELETGQRQLAKQTRELEKQENKTKEKQADDMKDALGKELAILQRENKTLRDKSAMSTLWNQGFGFQSQQSGAEIERAKQAVAAGDWQTARQTVQRAESYLRSMQMQAEMDAQARVGGQLTQELQKDTTKTADHAEKIRKQMEPGAQSGQDGQADGAKGSPDLKKLEQAQAKLQDRLQKLQEKLKPGSEKAPPVPEEGRQALDGGDKAMKGAREKMEGGSTPDAASKAEEAAEQLAKARQEMEKMKQKMEQQASGNQPGGKPSRPDGEGASGPTEKVEIPHGGSDKGDRREEVMKGMREGIPKPYQDMNKRYYDRLVK